MGALRDFIFGLLVLGPLAGMLALIGMLFGWVYVLSTAASLGVLFWLVAPLATEAPLTPGNAFQTSRRQRYYERSIH